MNKQTPAVKPGSNRPRTNLWWWTTAVVVTLVTGCGDSRDEPSTMPAPVEATQPEYDDGPCDEGAVEACRIKLGEHNGVTTCVEGTRTCVDGEWSDCEGGMS
jgi:hypothetical protein